MLAKVNTETSEETSSLIRAEVANASPYLMADFEMCNVGSNKFESNEDNEDILSWISERFRVIKFP